VPRRKGGNGEDKKIELVQREENVRRRVFVCFQRKVFAESLL
jgi:hypothetical protein